jgi:hypothetical protein
MLQIVNAALVSQGQYSVETDDGSDEWMICSRNWPLIVEAELENGAYSFSRQQQQLLTRIDGKFGFNDGYAVPLEALHVRRLWIETDLGNRIFPDWTQDGSNVYLDNADGCFVEIVVVANEDLWSANFCLGVQKKLEAVILRAIKEEEGAAAGMDAAAEMFFERARVKSSRSRAATEPYREGRFARARFGRG